jgi:putative membrane protein
VRSYSWRYEWHEPPDEEDGRLLAYAIRFGINAFALWLASEWVTGFTIDGWASLIVMAAIFGIVNTFVRPVLLALSCPFILVTLGLFVLLLNTALLGLSAWLAGLFGLDVDIDGFLAAFLAALLISFVSFLLSIFVRGPLLRALR